MLVGFVGQLSHSLLHAGLHGLQRELANAFRNVFHRDFDREVIICYPPCQDFLRIGGQMRQRCFGHADEHNVVLRLHEKRLLVWQHQFLRAVAAVFDFGAVSLGHLQHVVQLGDRQATDVIKRQAIGLHDQAPGLGLIEKIGALALRDERDAAFGHLGGFRSAHQRAQKTDVADQFFVAAPATTASVFNSPAGAEVAAGASPGAVCAGSACGKQIAIAVAARSEITE